VDIESDKVLLKLEGHTAEVLYVVFSADGKQIVTASVDNTARIWDLSAMDVPAILKRLAELEQERFDERTKLFAGADDWQEELRKSGFDNAWDFVRFSTAELKRRFQESNESNRAEVVQEIEAARMEIDPRMFVAEYSYSVLNDSVRIDRGDGKSDFLMSIPTGFARMTILEYVFPMPDVTGKDFSFRTMDLGLGTAQIVCDVEGTTDSIEDLVRNSGKYRVKIWFSIRSLRNPVARTIITPARARVLRLEIVKVE
jgi:hypothetical protein